MNESVASPVSVSIDTPQLIMRLLNESDAPMILELLNEPAFITHIGDKGVRDLNGALNYINSGPLKMQKELGFSLYCCQLKSNNEAIGISGLIKRDGVEYPEVGFGFLARYCGQGFGYQSSKAVMEHAKQQLGITRLQAICNPDNTASIALLTKLAFQYTGNIVLPGQTKRVKLFDNLN
ncbi:alanine acetyltransferase [Thalassotalea insulae]|uniref:Alanine acetyltransferase n=1 Tax=Thalassotalea insulae TaxID=2056778 RepID=A0ABQ6GXV6_9GAMM|nr:GNAT family N-acetyltransferase [Thalassotalea insulae]GLX80004.1 alanine acetyltransferase [Thalassotalea insulae]